MRTIHKYPLDFSEHCEVVVPMTVGARILALQLQLGTPTLWAEVCTSAAPLVPRRFVIYGTGWTMPEYPWAGGQRHDLYIGTVQLYDLVWHVYEVF